MIEQPQTDTNFASKKSSIGELLILSAQVNNHARNSEESVDKVIRFLSTANIDNLVTSLTENPDNTQLVMVSKTLKDMLEKIKVTKDSQAREKFEEVAVKLLEKIKEIKGIG